MADISEAAFEAAIEKALLAGGPDAVPDEVREPAVPYGADMIPGGYRRRTSDDYDRPAGVADPAGIRHRLPVAAGVGA